MATRKFDKKLTAEWLEDLRKDLKPGDTLHTVIRGVAASGMSRHIDVYRFTVEDGRVVKYWLSPRVAAVTGFTFDDKKECLRVNGCGMDMCHHVVYSLGRVLWPEGFGVEGRYPNGQKRTPKSKEDAAEYVDAGMAFYGRNGSASGWDNDGGYALKQERI